MIRIGQVISKPTVEEFDRAVAGAEAAFEHMGARLTTKHVSRESRRAVLVAQQSWKAADAFEQQRQRIEAVAARLRTQFSAAGFGVIEEIKPMMQGRYRRQEAPNG